MKRQVCFWLVADKYAQAEAAGEIGFSASNRVGFDLLCVTSNNWKAGSGVLKAGRKNVSETIETQTKKNKISVESVASRNPSNS